MMIARNLSFGVAFSAFMVGSVEATTTPPIDADWGVLRAKLSSPDILTVAQTTAGTTNYALWEDQCVPLFANESFPLLFVENGSNYQLLDQSAGLCSTILVRS